MDMPSIINHNYYVVRSRKTNKTWICEAERFDDTDKQLYYYYGTYELGSDEHKNNHYLSNNYYDILPAENDEVRLATPEEIDILMDILEKNGIVTTLRQAKDKAKAPDLKGEDYSNRRFGYKIPEGYEFDVVVDGKIILKPIKPKYPTTYEECCKLLFPSSIALGKVLTSGYNCELLKKFGELLICRDAYWKIAGEQMGLDRPWEPNWTTFEGMPAIFRFRYNIVCDSIKNQHCLLVFPTEEMRNAFYENFKDLIESCKELL